MCANPLTQHYKNPKDGSKERFEIINKKNQGINGNKWCSPSLKPVDREYYTSYVDLYDWELYYDTIALAYFGGESYAIDGIKMFLSEQRPDGLLVAGTTEADWEQHSPNFPNVFLLRRARTLQALFISNGILISRIKGDMNW